MIYRVEWRYRRSRSGRTWVAEELVFSNPHSFSVRTRRYFETKEEAIGFAAKKNIEIWQKKREDEER